MSDLIGKTIGQYKIIEELGRGGMGIVYKAHDAKLDRFVALKFLPPHLNASDDDKTRFVQEARAAAALNHPNVCSIYDIQNIDLPVGADEGADQTFIVMEFVDGRTLHDKMAVSSGGTIPSLSIKQAIDIGIQIADGLAAAHEKGIVHRDIKPENIMVRNDGIVQIMDFGLAKLRGRASSINRLTKAGSTVGTAGYMSPEQVQGQNVDQRSDIFSLGVLLYELLTGQPPFKGVHETARLYEIVNVDAVPPSAERPEIEAELDRIVLECLQKEPAERYQSVGEVAKDLRRFKRESTRQRASRVTAVHPVTRLDQSQIPTSTQPAAETNVTPRPGLSPLVWILAAIILFLGAVIAYVTFRPVELPPSLHAEIIPPRNNSYSVVAGGGQFAISPDGKTLAFAAADTGGKTLLWARSLQSSSSRALAGTDEATYPFWSPDGKTICFFARGKMLKIDAEGGTPLTICDAPSARGGTWNKNGTIVFAPDQNKGLYRISAAGGKPEQLTRLDSTRNELTHRWPSFLPDQDHFLFFSRGSLAGFGELDKDHLYVGSLSTGKTQILIPAVSNAEYADGMLLYMRENSIVGQAFDAATLKLSGDPVIIVQDVQYTPRWSRGEFCVSQNGMLVYQPGGQETRPDLLLVNKTGAVVKHIGRTDALFHIAISPDGRKLAMDLLDGQSRNIDIWIYDIERGVNTRLTFSKAADIVPIWSPHSDYVSYVSGQGIESHIVIQPVSQAGQEEVITKLMIDAFMSDWSSDGKYLIYHTRGNGDIWVIPLNGNRVPSMVVGTEYNETSAKFSPDVRWIAYVSDESGKNEVYVRSFIPPGTSAKSAVAIKRQISTDGGTLPVWRRDGKGIFYVTPRGIMLAELKLTESAFEIERVTTYSSVRIPYYGDIHASGDLMITQTPQVASGVVPLNLIVNWKADLSRSGQQ